MQGDFRIGERLVRPRLNSIEHDGLTSHLEPKVMQVLVILATHARDVVTRQQIREQVWQNVFVGEDVLVRAISEIRRAFQDDPRLQHTIQTVPKVGYRLVVPVVDAESNSTEQLTVAEAATEPLSLAPNADSALESPRHPGRFKSGATRIFALFAGGVVLIAVLLYFLKGEIPAGVAKRGHDVTAVPPPEQKPASGEGTAKPSDCALQSGGIYELENVASRAVLEVPVYSSSNGALLDQWKSNAGANQRWVAKAEGPYWTFTNVSSKKRLDNPRGSRTAGEQMDQWRTNNAENQSWIVLPVGDGSCKIISQASGLLLDVNGSSVADGAAVIQYLDNDGPNQHWRLRAVASR